MDISGRDVINDENLDKNWQSAPERPVTRWRVVTANWLSLLAMAHLLMGALAMAYLYWYATQKGLPTSRAPGTLFGPWALHDELNKGTGMVLNFPLWAVFLSALSLLFKLNIRAVAALALSLFFGFFALLSLLGLTED